MGDIKKLYKYLQSRKVQGLGSEEEFKDGFLNDSAFSQRVYDYVKPLFDDIEGTHKEFVDGFREPKNNTAYATPVPYEKKKYYGIGDDYPDWVDKQKQYFGNPPKNIDEAAIGIKKANNMELTPQEKRQERQAKIAEHIDANAGIEAYNTYKREEAAYRAAITSRLDTDIERAKEAKRAKEEEINKTIPQGSRALALFPQAKMAVQWTIPAYTLDVLEDTKELLEAPTKGSNWAGSMWAGFRDNADIKSFLSLGMSTFAKTGKVYDICSRYTNGEKLTDEETNLLEALAMNTAVAGLRAGDISGWYRSGEVTGDMVEIMGQFLLTGGIGTGASKVVSKAIGKTMQKILPKVVSKMGAKGAVGTVLRGAKFAGKGAVDVVAGGAAQSIYMPSTYSGYWEKKSGTVTHGDKDGEYNIEPSKINDLQAMLSSMAETGTERLGGAFVGAGSKILKNIVPKSWAKLSTKGAIGALIKAGGTANKYMAKAGVNSTMGELSEEFAGAAFDKAIGASSDEEWKAFWSKDNMLQMIGGFAPMSMFGLGMNGATIANKRLSALRSKRKFVAFTREAGSKEGVKMAEDILNTPIEDLGNKMHKYTQEIGGYTDGELNDKGVEFNYFAAEMLRRSTERNIADEWDSDIRQEAEDNVNTGDKRTIDDTVVDRVDDRVDDTEQTIPQVQQGDEVEYDNARWIVGDVAEEDGEYTFGDESIPLKKGNVLMFEADGNGIRILESTADLYAEDKDNGIESRRQEIYEKYRPVMNVDTGNIIQLSSTADNDNIAYVVKGRVVYDEEGNIDYDKSDDTIYYKVYDKEGNEVDGGTPRPLHLKTHRTEFGKVLSDTPIEEYVDNELYPQDETEQSSATGSVSTYERQEVTDENGLPFVKTSNGVTDFGYIPEDTGLTPAPIRLSIGDERTGLQHIVDRHGEQIAKAGFDNVVDFVEYVAGNYDTITEGVDTSGEPNGTYLLQAKDKHNNTLYVELSNDGSYWNINSGGVFRKGYGEKNKVVWSASEVQRGLKSATPDTLRSQDEADNQGDPNRTVSDTTSTDKGTTNNLNIQNTVLDSEEADLLMSAMEQNAEAMQNLELNYDNWLSEFGRDGIVDTPIGSVKMGDNQFLKMSSKERQGQFGMVRPTLTNPDIIIEEPSEARVGQSTERGSSYLFVKTFDVNGEKIRHFESITVKKDGLEVSVSSHIIKPAQLKSRLLNGSILWSKPQIANSIVSGEQQTLDDSRIQDPNANNHGSEVRVSTDGKGTTKNRNTQNTVLNNKPELTSIGSDGYLTETRDGQSDLVPTQEANSDSQGKGTTNKPDIQEEFYNSLPRNKKGEIDESLMSAEQKIRYAQAEFGEDEELVKEYISEQSKALSEKIAKLTNKTGKSVAEYKELAALKADKNVFVDYLHSLRDMQEDSMPRQTVEEAAAKREESRREEQAQREQMVREKEEREGVPDFLQDTPEDARLRGFRLRTGERIDRQEPIEVSKYNMARRKFTNDTGAVEEGRPTVKRTIIDNAQTRLQPSHRGGRANIYHFITEAQPKERTDKASRVSAAQIAANINPEEITGGITAYNGSPIANNRLEVIQGNNRAEALRLMYEEYPQSAETYKQYLIDNAENYGMSADEVRTMKEPIAVDIYEGTDGNAILLGQYTQQDVESGGVHRINPSGVVKHLKSHNMLDRFITTLLNGVDEENSVSDVISSNLRGVLPILDKTGAISMTQRQGFFDERGDVTSGAIDDFKGILTSLITEGGYANINSDFLNLPESAKTALYLQTYRAILNQEYGQQILGEIQDSILLYTLVFGKNNKGKVGADEARREVMSWLMTAQPDFNTLNEDGTYPLVDMRKKFSNFAAELAILYKSTNLRSSKDKGRGLYNIWDDFYNLLEGKGDLFTAGEKKSLQESINENFNIDYVPIRQNERNTLGGRGEASRAGRRGSESELSVGEQSEAGTAAADDRGRTEADIAEAVKDIDVEPTEAQKKAGNYKKGHVKIQGFDITIENPKGAIRKGVDDNGKAWSTEMKNHYGYFKNTEGKDGDHIDVFIGDNPNSKRIFVVDQVNPKTKEFDESKVMLGFDTEDEAKKAYLSNYSKDWKGFKDITYVDIDTFRDWLYDGAKQRKPFGEYSNISFRSIKDINDRFNEELQQQIDGTLPKGHVYSLGMPNDILRSAGLPNLPIEMSAEMLKNKSSANYRQHHPFDISSIKDLPRAIQNPIAVFNNPNNDGKVLLTELQYNGVNHIVAIKVRSERKSNNVEIDVNSVSTVFPKDRIEKIVEWLLDKENQGRKAYLNKEKVLTWLSDNETITRSKGYNTKDIAKVIKDFDNPTLSGEKNEIAKLKSSKHKARGATTEKLEELVTLLKKTGFADVKTGEDFYNALAEISYRYSRPNGTVLGFVKGNTIYLNPDEVSLNTPIHEFGHLWVSQVKEHFPDLWAKGKELFLESDYLRKVQADENYRHLDLDGQIDEAMARAIGDRGEQELDKTLLEKILDWIAEVWEKIGGVFGIDNLTSEQISNLTLQDFTDMATSELLSGQNLTERVNGNRGGATRYNTKAKQEKEEIAKRDEIYLEALQRGDMETAIRMVNEAAAQNGYTPNSEYQGTSAYNGKAPYGNGYFLTKEERKEAFENDEFEGDTNLDDYINSGIDPKNLDLLTNDNNYRQNDDARKEAIENLRNVIRNKRQTITMYRSVPSSVKEGSFRNGDWVTPSRAYALENARIHGWGNQYRIIEQEVPISDVWFDGNDIAEFGYGNEDDFINDKDYLYSNTNNNRKLPDIVTYDNKGNIIPLSKRFNKAKNNPRYNTADETADIKAKAISDGTFMKAPNGKDTNLTERQWLQVRTKAFKKWFGDWEKTARIEKLKKTKPIEITGEEVKPSDDLKEYKKNALEYGKTLQGEYTNKDTGITIQLQRGRKNGGLNEVLQHDYKDREHLQSIAAIPQIIENATYIDSEPNNDIPKNPDVKEYQYYVCGLKIGGEDYTVRAVVAVDNKGDRYYDHKLTNIEKGKLLDQINSQAIKNNGFGTTPGTKPTTVVSEYKDSKLISLLQENSSKVVDENGEPLVVYHGTNKFGFTVFDKEFSDDKTSIFFADRVDIAKGYAGVNADVRSLYDDDTTGGYSKDEMLSMLFADVDISSHTNGWDVANDILPYITEDIGITAEYDDEDGVLTLSSDYTGDTYRLTDEEFSWEKVENWLRDNADLENVIDKDAGIYGVFVNARNVLDIDAGGSMWSSIPKKKVKGAEGVGNMNTRDIVEHAKKLNYDGVYIKDLLDTGGRGYGLVGDIEGDIFISLVDKNQIKSATDNIGTFDGEDGDIRYSVGNADYFVNERFNEQLEKLTEKNADSTMFRLGYPDMILQSTGIPNKELRLYGNKLLKKAEKHDFNVKDLVDLPTSIQTPMFVFKGNHPDSFSIVTELKIRDKNVLVSIERNKDGEVDFNLISSVYGKSGRGIVHWLNNGKALYVNKEKALDYLRISAPIAEAQDKGELNPSVSTEKALAWQAALAPIASATLKQELITATKIIENFENPPINEKKVIDDTTNDMVRYSIKASEQLDKEDEIMGKKAAEIYEARVKMGKQMNQSDPKKMPNKKIFDEINEKTENRRAKIAEHAADCYLPMKHLIEIFNKHGYNIADYNNWYMNVFALAGKNEAEYEKYQAERSVPLQRAAKAAMDSGQISYRELENYLILKHGQERNQYYKERDEKLGVKPMKDYSGTEAVMFEEFCKRTGIEVKTIEEDIPKLVDGDPNMIKYDNGKSEFSKDGKKIPDSEVNERFELWRKQHTPEEIIEDYEEKIGKEKVEDLWGKIRKATQFTLDCQKEGGLTSEDMYKKASGMWEYFVPLRGFDMGTAQDEYDYDLNGITLFTDFRVEQTLGRTRRSVSPLAWTEQMAHITIQQKNKNLLNQSLRRLASVSMARKDNIMFLSKQYKASDVIENGKVVREGALINPPAHTGNPTEDSAAFERWETSMKEGVKNGTVEVVEHSNVNFGMIVSADKVKQHVVRVYEGGRPVDIIFNTSPSVPRAINGLNNKTVVLNDWFSRQVKAGTRLIAQTMTTYNPAFVGKNFMRDYLFANTMLMGKEDRTYRANFNKNIVKAHSVMFDYVKGKSLLGWAAGDKESVRDNEYGRLLTEFVMNGGKTGFSQMFKFEKMSSDFKKQTERGDKTIHYGINDYIHFIEAMNDYAENITRFAAYCASRQAGRSIERSISDAKELTINFNRKGTDGGIWGTVRSLCAFSNASIQALVVFSRGVRANPKRLSAIISSYVAMPIAMAIVASLVGGDDYFKLSKYDRQNNICIPMFGGGFIKIPLPQELRVFWKLGDEIALCIYRNEPPEVAAQEVFMGALDLLPSFAAGATSISDVLDEKIGAGDLLLAHQPITIIQPITQLAANRNFLNYRIYDDNKWGGRRKELPEYRKALRNKGGETYSPNFVVKLSEGIGRLTGGSDLKRGVVEVNPDAINHLMRGYFGGLYSSTVAAINMGDKGAQSIAAGEMKMKTTDSPTMKAFYVSPSNLRYTDDILNARYMDVLKEAKKHADVYANYLKEGEVDRFEKETKMTEDEALDWRYLVKSIDKEVQELRNEIATAETTKERDEALRQLEALQREAIEIAEGLKK